MTKNDSHRKSFSPSTENELQTARAVPKKINLILFLLYVSVTLILLLYTLYYLYTGRRFSIDAIRLLFGEIMTAQTKEIVIPFGLFCGALFFLIYAVVGIRRGGLRNIIPTRGGTRDRTYYQGLPMWVMLLSYLSLGFFLIRSALALLHTDALFVSRSWKFLDADNIPLAMVLVFYFTATLLDGAIGGRDMQDVLASLRERFGGDSDAKKVLLEKGIAYDRKTFFEFIQEGDTETVKLFLDSGMHVDGVDPLNTDTPLSLAARNGNKELVKLLLERKADVNKAAKHGLPPVWSTAYDFDDTTVLQLLVNHGADIDVKNSDGKTLLMEAAEALSIESVKLLLEHKADINARAHDGHTALTYAIERMERADEDSSGRALDMNQESYQMTRFLLENGADPNVKILGLDSKNNTPLKIARSRKVKEVVQLLESYHALE